MLSSLTRFCVRICSAEGRVAGLAFAVSVKVLVG